MRRFFQTSLMLILVFVTSVVVQAQSGDGVEVVEVLPAEGALGVQTNAAITVIFNRPVVPLSILEDQADFPSPIELSPAVEGDGEWLNTSIYIFRPDPALAGGTQYEVRVDSVESADGAAMRTPFSWAFRTVPPQIVEVDPAALASDVPLDPSITVTFNQPMNQESAERAFTLRSDASGVAIPGAFNWEQGNRQFVFSPDDSLALNQLYTAEVTTDAQPLVGDASLEAGSQWSFSTVPPPSIIGTSPVDGGQNIGSFEGFSLLFASPMNPETIEGRVSISPEPESIPGSFYSDFDNRYRVNFYAAPSTTYTITVEPGMEDIYGNVIDQGTTVSYRTAPLPPDVALQVPGPLGFYNANRDATDVFVTYRNISDVDLRLYDLPLEDFIRRTTAEDNFDPTQGYIPPPQNLLREWRVSADVPQNVRRYDLLNLGAVGTTSTCNDLLPSRLVPGDMSVVITDPNPVRARSAPPDGEIVELLYRGYRAEVLAGPQCLDGIPWYQLQLREGQTGWVAESVGEEYLLAVEGEAEATAVPVTRTEDGGALAPGLYMLEAASTQMPQERPPARHFLMVSTLNVTLKFTADSAVAWVTDVQTGDPVFGLPVQFFGEGGVAYGESVTGEDGIAEVAFDRVENLFTPLVALVDTGDQFGLALESFDRGIEPYRFDLRSDFYPDPYTVYMYTDRPVYRPGQPVYFRGVIRSKDDVTYTVPAAETMPVQIRDNNGDVVYSENLPLTEYGTFSDTFMIADDAALGGYTMNYILPGAEFDRTGLFFSVAEFRVPEFQVDVAAQTDAVVQGDDLIVRTESSYFFGGPVSAADVSYAVSARPFFFRYEGEGNYSFEDFRPGAGTPRFFGPTFDRQIASGGGILTGADGSALIEIPADLEDETSSQRYTIEATVSDETGAAVSGRTEAIVHKGLFYTGVGLDGYVVRVDEETAINLITVDWDSLPVSEQDVEVTVLREEYNTVQEQDDFGRTVFNTEVEEIEVLRETVATSDDGTAVLPFTPLAGGVYRVIAAARDDNGNEIIASRTLYVSSTQYVTWRQQDNNRIDIFADAEDYNIGDTAEILITSPFQGEATALITVERGDVLTTDVVTLTSNSEVYELPITEDYAPNVFVTVMLVKGVDENNPIAAFRSGGIGFNVETARKVVNIDVATNTEQAGPGDTVEYTVTTTDYRGEPVVAEVGVGLTDLASLSVGEPNSGPILEQFYGLQSLGVRTSTPLTVNVDVLTQTVIDTIKGGGGGGGGGGGVFEVRGEFVDTAYWNAELVTGEDGEATFEVELPDNLTTWRLDTRAVTRGSETDAMLVGQDTFDLLATKPLLIRPVTPRFFVVDDEVTLAAVVNNNTGSEQEVEVLLEADGVTFDGDPLRTATVPDGGRARVEWQVVVENVESVDATFFVQGQGFEDASRPPLGAGDDRLLPVYRYDVPETVGTAGVLREGGEVTETIALPEDMTLGGGTLSVSIDPSLASTTLDGLTYLRNFPHQCTEQTVSRFLPNIVTYRALAELGVADAELEIALDEQVNLGLQMLYAQQKPDGGWGWFVQDDSNPLTTAYALIGLHEARGAGYPVEAGVIQRAQEYLNANIPPGTQPGLQAQNWERNRAAFVLYALATSGSPNVAATTNLYESRANLSIYAQAYLALALHSIDPNDATRTDVLVGDIFSAASTSATGTFWTESEPDARNWNSDTRTTAIVLEMLVTLAPESELIPNVVRYLVSARTADAWETTQETAWAVMSLTDWMLVSGELQPDYTFTALLNDEGLFSEEVTSDNVTEDFELTVEVADLLVDEANRLVLQRGAGDGVMYYTAHLEAFLPVDAVEPLSNGISVSRRYVVRDGEDLRTVDTAAVGDVVEVRLTVVVPDDAHYVLIEDPIPAGTEPIDPNLETSQQIGTRPELSTNDPLSQGWGWWWFSNIEYRDEKVSMYSTYLPAGTYEYVYSIRASVPGTYNVIPPTGEQFYFPEVYGRGAGGIFTVMPTE